MTDITTEFKQVLEEQKYSKNSIYQYARYLNEYIKQYGDPANQPQKLIYKNIKKIQITKKGKIHGETPSAPKDEGGSKGVKPLEDVKKTDNRKRTNIKISYCLFKIKRTTII